MADLSMSFDPASVASTSDAASSALVYGSSNATVAGAASSAVAARTDQSVKSAAAVTFSALTVGSAPITGEASISFIIDGGGNAITTGAKGDLEVPFDCTINSVTLVAAPAGAIVIDIWKQAYADFPPEDAQTITSATPPTITATADKSQDTTLTSWTVALTKGDTLRFNVDSVTTIERVTLSLKVDRT